VDAAHLAAALPAVPEAHGTVGGAGD
jgi:hypothetical protein